MVIGVDRYFRFISTYAKIMETCVAWLASTYYVQFYRVVLPNIFRTQIIVAKKSACAIYGIVPSFRNETITSCRLGYQMRTQYHLRF